MAIMGGFGKFLAGILSSVIVLAIGYYFFSDKPGAPDVLVTEKTLAISPETTDGLFWDLANQNGDVVNLEKLKEKARYSSGMPYGLGFRLLEIENKAAQTYEKIEILTSDLVKVVVQQGKSAEIFDGDLGGKLFRLTPGAKLQILGVGGLTSALGNNGFTVMIDGKSVPIEDTTIDSSESNFSTVMWFRRNSFLVTVVLPMIMWGILVILASMITITFQNPKTAAAKKEAAQEPSTPNNPD